jgi:hypothetical protein
VIVDDLDVEGIRAAPNEANSPLIIDPNAVLPLSLALQGLETIPGRDSEVSHGHRSVQEQ